MDCNNSFKSSKYAAARSRVKLRNKNQGFRDSERF